MNKEQLAALIKEKSLASKAILEKQDATEEELKQAEALIAEAEALKQQYTEIETREANLNSLRERAQAGVQWAGTAQRSVPFSSPQANPNTPDGTQAKRITIPATALRTTPKNFRARDGYQGDERAYGFGMFFLATAGRKSAQDWCRDHGIVLRDLSESVDTAGGVLVPPEYSSDIINLKEQYGVFRQNCGVTPMMSDTLTIPRRTGGLTVYSPGEGAAITTSDLAWDNVMLTARKFATLTYVSNELNADAIISMADQLAEEIAYAFADKEDDCGFNGDGTSTYFGINGLRNKLKGLSGTIANIAGLFVGTGNLYSELVLADFESVVAKLPQYADTPRARWFVHRSFFYEVMLKVALAAGGVTKEEIINGQRTPSFLGYPVAFSQKMPKTEANSQVCALLGDLALAAKLGDRGQDTIATDTSVRFANDQLAVRGIERVDIVVHDVGNASGTAADRVPGPIVGLITAAS